MSRFAFNIGFIDRPITFGLLFGAITGDLATALGICVFFELLWLDFFPAGTYIPPNRALPAFLCLALTHMLGLSLPADVLLLLLLTLPTAWLGAKLEGWQRVWQNASYNEAQLWVKDEVQGFRSGALIRRGVLQTVLLQGGTFLLIGLIGLWAVPELLAYWPVTGSDLGWGHLWSAALIGGVLSLRIKAAYGTLLAGLALAFFVIWFTSMSA